MGGRGSRGRALPQAGYGPGAETAAEKAARENTTADAPTDHIAGPTGAGDRIRTVYTDLAGSEGRWINLAELRDRLADLPRAEVDAALRELIRDHRVRMEPDPLQHRLSPAERDAAISIGGEDRHKIWIEPGRP